MYILGYSVSHDSAACLLKDGRIIRAIEEERLNRVKHSPFRVYPYIPYAAIKYVLRGTGLTFEDFSRRENIEHHFSHALSAYMPSPFDEAAILVVDGMGSLDDTFVETISLYHGRGGKIKFLKKQYVPHSLGLIYGFFTFYLQMGGFGEGKTMGLAPYGRKRSNPYMEPMRDFVQLREDGEIWVNPAYYRLNISSTLAEFEREKIRAYLARFKRGEYVRRDFCPEDVIPGAWCEATDLFWETFGPRRIPGKRLNQRFRDIAWAVQNRLEEAMIHIASHAYEATQSSNLCMAGGVALNCVANQRLLDATPFKRIFVQPAAADSGIAIGNACYRFNKGGGDRRKIKPLRSASLGHPYRDSEIKELLSAYQRGRLTVSCFDGFPEGSKVICNARLASDKGDSQKVLEVPLKFRKREGRFFGALDFRDASSLQYEFEVYPSADLRPQTLVHSFDPYRSREYEMVDTEGARGQMKLEKHGLTVRYRPLRKEGHFKVSRSISTGFIDLKAIRVLARTTDRAAAVRVGLFDPENQPIVSPTFPIKVGRRWKSIRVPADAFERRDGSGTLRVQDNYQILFFGLDGDRRSRSVQIKQVEMVFLMGPTKISPKPYTWSFNLSPIRYRKMTNTTRTTARLLSRGAIIGWFQRGSEFGPRALGNRSILVDPRRAEMKDILNSKVKHREPFRPFAPSVLRERAEEFFILTDDSPFMLLAPPVRKEAKKLIPAVVHVDGTARVQTVNRRSNPVYYDLIKAFGDITGVPVVLNTSFNLAGDPIVETPLDAFQCFLNTKMDYLVLHDYLIWKAEEEPPGLGKV